jgi:hypothetical protein
MGCRDSCCLDHRRPYWLPLRHHALELDQAPHSPGCASWGGLWFNTQQREREQRIANDRAQDEALQAYLDQMSQLLTDKDQPLHEAQLGDSLSPSNTANVCARTTVLRLSP